MIIPTEWPSCILTHHGEEIDPSKTCRFEIVRQSSEDPPQYNRAGEIVKGGEVKTLLHCHECGDRWTAWVSPDGSLYTGYWESYYG